jgi:WD40 repeat protein/transcriptional regulator with XRE-family HTH domain
VDLSRPDPARVESATDLARELTLLRERRGLTVRDVQRLSGIVHSTLGGYFSGRHRPSLDRLELVLTACGVEDRDERAAWCDALLRARRAPHRRPPVDGPPYRGLEPFRTVDAGWFFGRTRLTADIVARIGGNGPLIVVGPSGVGKSSLLRAGVVPALEARAGTRAEVITPGRRPAAVELPEPVEGVRTVLVVDQFEEVLADGVCPAQRAAFVAALVAGPFDVVIGLRADFYARAVHLAVLAAALQRNQVIVGGMDADELREAVLAPAARAGVAIEDGLVELLLADIDQRGDAGAGPLPLLSHALLATWRRGGGSRMTMADYRTTGGIGGAVAATAEEAMTALGPGREEAVRALFLRLVHVAPDALVTRRQVDRDELPAAATVPLDEFVRRRLVVVDSTPARSVAVELAHEALLVAWPRLREWIETDRAGIVARRQLAESAREWREHGEDPDSLLRGARLVAAGEQEESPVAELNDLETRFLAASRDQERLRSTFRARQARRLRTLVAALMVLLLVAVVLGVHSVAQGMDTTRERDNAVSRQVAVRSDALRGRDPALAAQLAVAAYRVAPTPEARSSLLDATGVAVPARLPGPPAVTESVALDGARSLLVSTSGSAPTAQVWDVRDRGRPARIADTPPAAGPLQVVALSPDGRTLAAGGAKGDVVLVGLADPARPAPPVPLATGGGDVPAVAFTTDGATLLAGTADRGVRRWSLAGTRPVELPALPGPAAPVQALAAGSGGLVAAGFADGTVGLWGPGGALPQLAVPGAGKIYAVAFSPDGRTLAAGGADRTVHLWDVTDPGAPVAAAPLTGATNWVNAVAFGPDGRTLAAGSSDGDARIYDLSSRRTLATLPHPGPVTAVGFLDADTLATGEADGVAHLWPVHPPVVRTFGDAVFAVGFDASGDRLVVGPGSKDDTAGLLDVAGPGGPRELGVRVRDPDFSGSAALTPDGRTLAAGRSDGTVRLWDVADPARPVALPAPPGGATALVEQLTTSADGRLLAASGDDNAVRVWDIANPAAARAVATLTGADSYVLASAFSRDGHYLAAASADTRTYLWDLRASPPRLVSTLDGPSSYAYSPSFSPDGRTLAVGSADKSVRLYDITDPAHPTQLGPPITGPSNYVYTVAFSPDGRLLAAASTDGTVWIWDVTRPRSPKVFATLTGPTEAVFSVAWSPDGTRLAAGSGDRTVRLWSADPQRAATALCARTGASLSSEEWARYVPDLPFAAPC